jgi:exodeoxyribonuclease V alpha subunit
VNSERAKTIESVSGLIERVTFFSEETGFAVLRVKVKGRHDLVTVIGSAPSVSAGEWLTAEGEWVRDKEHGFQLKAQLLRCVPPTTREGIERYLGSGMVKGIGPIYAKKLVHKFGETIFDIIENFSARLEEVEGIGPGRRRKIKEAWAEQKVIREIMIFLHSHGVSTARAVRIYKTYGEQAIDKVQANPYLLARDIHGIGFKTADQIAQTIGIPRDSILRAQAGLEHLLSEATGEGHCALPRALLLEEAVKLLDAPEDRVAQALLQMLQKRELTNELIHGEDLIFLPGIRTAEEGIAATIRELAERPPNLPKIDIEKAIAWAEEKTGKKLGEAQKEAVKLGLSKRVLIITGGPGVGKTTLLNALLAILRAKKLKCLLCAPTGRAAKRLSESTGMQAQTIHRLLEIQKGQSFGRNASLPLEGDLVVVDETSMVDVPLMHALLRAHPSGANLILVGDIDQLPSVGPGRVLGDLIESSLVPVVRLTEVFRQAANSRIITTAHRINEGAIPDLSSRQEDSDFFFVERDDPDQIIATVKEIVSKRIPKRFSLDPLRDIQVLAPMNRGSLGVRDLNALLQAELNPRRGDEAFVEKFGWQFRLRDKVMQTENNYDKDVFNGDIGQISEIDPIEREVRIRFDQREVIYDFGELDEITLAYAITIHKAQGSEFPAVVIPLAMQQYVMLQRNLIYTAITRGKQLVVVIGQKKAFLTAIKNNQNTRRFGGLLERLR